MKDDLNIIYIITKRKKFHYRISYYDISRSATNNIIQNINIFI